MMDRLTVSPLDAKQCLHAKMLGVDAAEIFNALPLEAREAIEQYVTDSETEALVLREDTQYLDDETILGAWYRIAQIEDAMMSLDHDIVVWRGCSIDRAHDTIRSGSASLLSTSHSPDVALAFAHTCADHEGLEPALMRITVKAGHPLILVPPYLHHSRDEGEVLLDRSTALIETFGGLCDGGDYDEMMGVPVIEAATCGQHPYVEIPEDAFETS